jgi:small subunit ribosomal protein S20e
LSYLVLYSYSSLQTLRVTTRRAPSGQGTQTFERYQMRIHKRVIDVIASAEIVRKIANIRMDPAVDVEVSIDA